ncbi:hypothetical protein CDAR_584801 [Caerostris darwini]|uniref:Uncharacterized protein n=1 Tax=Caerostris darwini TaxID=1538125 RepID=A0AAV4QTT7_9ARAC|nr:hypothetical protein CDAR_584801 [Caerostris darwini]
MLLKYSPLPVETGLRLVEEAGLRLVEETGLRLLEETDTLQRSCHVMSSKTKPCITSEDFKLKPKSVRDLASSAEEYDRANAE